MLNFKMRTFSFRKKRYTVNSEVKSDDPVCLGMKDLTLGDRQTSLTLGNWQDRHRDGLVSSEERQGARNEDGVYNNIPRVYPRTSMPGSGGVASRGAPGTTQSALDPTGTTDRKMICQGPATSGNVLAPTQTLTCATGNTGGLIQGNLGLAYSSWPPSSYSAYSACPSSQVEESDYQSIKDLTMTSPTVGHDDIKRLHNDPQRLRHRLASTSSSSGVSSASEKSVASSLYASFKAILDKRKAKAAHQAAHQEIKVTPQTTSPTTSQTERYSDQSNESPGNIVRITTKRSKSQSKWRSKSTKNVKSPKVKSPAKSQKSRGKSPARPRRKRRVVALARGLGCVGGARSRSVTPERHQMHRIHQLSPSQKEDLNAMLKNVQQRVRTVLHEGRDALHDVDNYQRTQNDVTDVTNVQTYVPDVPARVMTPKIKAATLGSDVTGRRLSRWERHQERQMSPPDLSEVSCKRKSASAGRFTPKSDIQNRPLPPIPDPPRESSVSLIKTLDLSCVMKNSWISGLAVNSRRDEIILVDLEQAYVVDMEGNLKRIISNRNGKSSTRLKEPIDVCVLNDGTLVFSDHADRLVKLFNTRGQHLRSIHNQCHMNIAGVACNDLGQIFVAGTDSGCVSVYGSQQVPLRHVPEGAQLEHPYSVAINPLTGSVIVGDDYKQVVVALSEQGRVLWRYCPTGERHFFPSSICVDSDGYIFIADLYNEKIYMLDSGGKLLKTLLSKGKGLHGGPGAIATDGKGHLYVADQEKSLKIFKYGQDGFAMYRRFSIVKK